MDEVLPFAREMSIKYPNAEFIVTGHSLGAAVSVFAALDINKLIKPVKLLYNFGSPRVGNQ
jgi:predicted lipase